MTFFLDREDNDVISRQLKKRCKTCPHNNRYPECAPYIDKSINLIRVCRQDDRDYPPAAIETDWRYGHN